MIFCDLSIDSVPVWFGLVCLDRTVIGNYSYLGFNGALTFIDTQGTDDPDYTGFPDRFGLVYLQAGQPNVQVPLQQLPSQQFDIILGGQYCTLSIYQK